MMHTNSPSKVELLLIAGVGEVTIGFVGTGLVGMGLGGFVAGEGAWVTMIGDAPADGKMTGLLAGCSITLSSSPIVGFFSGSAESISNAHLRTSARVRVKSLPSN